MKKITNITSGALFLLFFASFAAYAQDIQTSENYFDRISEQYGKITDYEAKFTIIMDKDTMKGTMYYKTPNLLRLNFSDPAEQVIAINGESLIIYIPKYSVVMRQKMKRHSSATLATMASRQGLLLLKRNYSVAFLTGPDPVPLEEGSKEKVVKLKLKWRSIDEGFRELEISIGENGLIRRIIGITVEYTEIQFDFKGILINQNIPDVRFVYDPPASANVYDNFLFEPEN